ncbi:MAG TPA: bacteriocin ABC transporter ATP-binding protein, partial [Eubacterium sp.]|nr:bacteriocin ABC transporter ATP-binding protein [Eubacterium sp.]
MINIKAIKKSYEKRDVLCGISLDIREGEITFIVGRSGCGKSTFLNILGGLEIPDEGSVLYNGKDISEDLDSYRRTEVGFVFQGFNLVDGLSALENIKLAQLYAGTDISDDMIEDNLKRFGIKDPFQPSETLSGGEMQRTALLRSSLKNCDVIIADEPTGSLDEENSAAVFDL